jgi:hypothetical protein
MHLDTPPPGRKPPPDPRQIQKLKKGGKLADQIRREREQQHALKELPEAEKELEQKLQETTESASKPDQPEPSKPQGKISWWQRLLRFLRLK